jgi:hypothetical protein
MKYWSISCGAHLSQQTGFKGLPVLWSDQTGSLTVEAHSESKDRFAMDFPGFARAEICWSGRNIQMRPITDRVLSDTLQHLLLDQVLPRVIAHEHQLVLHASAVQRDGGTIIFLGESGRGKSTLSASLQGQGWTLLGDDALIISGGGEAFFGEATYKSLRLLPDSIAALYASQPKLQPVAHYTRKQRVALPFSPNMDVQPIQAIFLLGDEPQDGKITVKPVSAVKTCMALITNSFALDPTDKDRAIHKLGVASDMAMNVSTFELSYPRDYARLLEVHEAIQDAIAT